MSMLSNALKKMDAAVKDLTSLHVQTYTGNMGVSIDGSQTFEDIQQLVKDAAASPDGASAKITLVAESLYKFDGDSYNFVASDQDTLPEAALELHKAAVEGGIRTRQGLMQMVKGIF